MIQRIQTSDMSFKGARMNILAMADSHGNFMKTPKVLKTIQNNLSGIYPDAGAASTKNILAMVGDMTINPSKKGFITHPECSNGDVQTIAILKMIDTIRADLIKYIIKTSKNVTAHSAISRVLDVVFTSGNHDLDAGENFLLGMVRKLPMTTILTNLKKLDNKPANLSNIVIGDEINTEKLCKAAIVNIPDSKKPDMLHKVLFVSATIPSMEFYSPGQCKGFEFFDNCDKKDANLGEEDIRGTIDAIKNEVDAFKAANPKGAVILLSHMGGRLSEMICKNVPQINQVLNGHDHKNVQTNVGKTSINSLGKDFEMLKALNLEFDDDGNLIKMTMTPYFTDTTLEDGLENHPYQLFLEEFLKKDLEPLISLGELKSDADVIESQKLFQQTIDKILDEMGIFGEDKTKYLNNSIFKSLVFAEAEKRFDEITSVDKPMDKLGYGNEIRYQSSYLMNYLTSAVKRAIRESIDPEIFTVALQSSIVRGSLSDGANNLDVMKVFDGVSEDLSNLKIGSIKGEELVGLIVENVLSNLKDKTRNTIIDWSDVQVNRSLIADIRDGKVQAPYSEAIRVRNKFTKEFEPIDLSEKYKMVIGEKFLVKNDIEWPKKIRSRFKSINKTYDQLFREYISSVNYKLHITPKTKEERIL